MYYVKPGKAIGGFITSCIVAEKVSADVYLKN